MVKIIKTKTFEKMEEKYLKKLNPKQQNIYNQNIDMFMEGWNNNNYLLHTHSLKWDWSGYHAFTCLRNSWRDDRIVFKILEWNESNYSLVELVEFELVWDHKIYE